MHRSLLSTVVVSAAIVAAAAARADTGPRTIDEAALIAAIESADPRIERRASDVDAARAEVLAAGVRPDPTIAFDREEVFGEDGSVPTSYLRVVWPLDVSGRRGRRVAAARVGVAAAKADVAATTLALVVEGVRVFRQAAYARLRVELLAAERGALARAVEIVRRRAGAGDAAGYEVRRLELELAAYDDLTASAQIELQVARRQLGAVVGDGELVDAAGELPVPPAPALDELLAGLFDHRGDYQAARLRRDAADADHRVADRAWVPALSLTGGVMTADLGDETAVGYVAGISMSLPLFDRGAVGHARARAARRAADAEVRILERRAPAAVRLAHDVLVARIEQARHLATDQLDHLDALLQAVETGYREGAAGIVELLDAHRAARDARLRALELRRDANLDELEVWLALGHRP